LLETAKEKAMGGQIPLDSSGRADDPGRDDSTHEIAPDLAYRRLAIANVVFFGRPARATGSGC
jgi:hypothetical protein